MKAIIRHRYGSPEVIEFDDLPLPRPGPDELVVELRAAGVHRGDALELRGWPWVTRALAHGARRPRRPGLGTDIAGTVIARGVDADGFDIGDEVAGWANGAFAEAAVMRATDAVARPVTVDAIEAATLPTSAVAAAQAVGAGGVEPGHRVLVIGASGGVGTFAVQLAVARGAVVTAVVGTDNVDLAWSLGAHQVLDHRAVDVAAAGARYDVVLDLVGTIPLRRLRRTLTGRGVLVVVGGSNPRSPTGLSRFAAAAVMSPFGRGRLVPLLSRPDPVVLAELVAMVDSGDLRPVVAATFPLAATADAIRQLETGHPSGKLVITP